MFKKVAPLSGGFFVAGFVLLFVAILKIWPWNKSWGFTMVVFSVVLITSSLISMNYADSKAMLKLDHIKLGGKK